jgi:hypothetical protein
MTIDVPHVWPDTLVLAGLLAPHQANDKKAVRAATERFIADGPYALQGC